jgi:hypothetical protein
MSRIVSYLSKPNHEVRDTSGRFEGTFRWRWLASLWATIHPDRHMHLVQARAHDLLVQERPPALPTPAAAVIQAPAREPAAGDEIRSARSRRPRRRPAVQRAA